MKAEYNSVFDKITPVMSNDELLAGVLGKAEKMDNSKKRIRKPIIAVCAAAITICGTITAVGASCEWDFNKLFGDFFKGKTEISEIAENNSVADVETIEKMYDYDFEKSGKLIDETYHCDGFDLVVKGATATDTSLCIAYDVIFNEDFPYGYSGDDKEYELWRADTQLNIHDIDPDLFFGVSASIDNPIVNGNVFSIVTVFNVTDMSLTGKTVTIDFNRLFRHQKRYDNEGRFDGFGEEQSLDCGIKMDLDIDFSRTEDTIAAEIGKEANLNCGSVHEATKVFIERINLSPYAVSIEYSNTNEWIDFRDDITMILDDGTVLRGIFGIGTGGSSGTLYECSEHFESPINIFMISSITIGDLEIPLK